MILFSSFVTLLLLTFTVLSLLAGSARDEKLARRRLQIVLAPKEGRESLIGPTSEAILKVNHANKLQWLDSALLRYQVVKELDFKIRQANITMSVSALLMVSAGLSILGFIVSYLCISVLAIQVLTSCALGYLPIAAISWMRARRIAAFNAGLPDAIDMMGRAMRAGHSMAASMNTIAEQSVEPVKSEFCEMYKQQNFGLPLRDALNQMLERMPSQDLKVLVTGILVQKETGGNLAEILDRTAAVIRERLRIQGEIRTHTAQGRMTGWILCSLPVVMLFIINLVNPGYSNVLLNTQIGHLLICVGLGLLIVGAVIIRSIINGIEI
jgi:tight adherence protein B